MDIDFELTGGRIVRQELIKILCDDSTGRRRRVIMMISTEAGNKLLI